MQIWQIRLEKQPEKFLSKIDKNLKVRLLKEIQKLPDATDTKPLTNYPRLHRLRVGDFRVIYRKEGDLLTIIVLQVGSRGDIYKWLARQD